jgi:hypothetical protein
MSDNERNRQSTTDQGCNKNEHLRIGADIPFDELLKKLKSAVILKRNLEIDLGIMV